MVPPVGGPTTQVGGLKTIMKQSPVVWSSPKVRPNPVQQVPLVAQHLAPVIAPAAPAVG